MDEERRSLSRGVSWREKWLALILVCALGFGWNWPFLRWCSLSRIMAMNDVQSILIGYRGAPNLWVDGLKWWHGTWIQAGIASFRPLASYLYWIECDVGLRHGFLWCAWFGFLLFVINCLLASALAWRLTRSRICMVIAAVLAAHVRYHNVGQPPLWLAWFPCHQELLMNAWMLGALLCFDVWYERAEVKYLGASWFCFVIGCLTKEHVYVFPLFAVTVVLLRRQNAQVTIRVGLLQAGSMLLTVLVFWFYRAAVIEHPRNPHLTFAQFIDKSGLFLFTEFGRYFFQRIYLGPGHSRLIYFSRESWFPGLGILLFILIGGWVKLAKRKPSSVFVKAYVAFPIMLVVLATYTLVAIPRISLTDEPLTAFQAAMTGFWKVFDRPLSQPGARDLVTIVFTCYWVYLLFLYRKEEPTLAAFSFLYLAHVPVLTFIGWHYTLPAWFVWSVLWSLVAKLIWINIGSPLSSRNESPREKICSTASR